MLRFSLRFKITAADMVFDFIENLRRPGIMAISLQIALFSGKTKVLRRRVQISAVRHAMPHVTPRLMVLCLTPVT